MFMSRGQKWVMSGSTSATSCSIWCLTFIKAHISSREELWFIQYVTQITVLPNLFLNAPWRTLHLRSLHTQLKPRQKGRDFKKCDYILTQIKRIQINFSWQIHRCVWSCSHSFLLATSESCLFTLKLHRAVYVNICFFYMMSFFLQYTSLSSAYMCTNSWGKYVAVQQLHAQLCSLASC